WVTAVDGLSLVVVVVGMVATELVVVVAAGTELVVAGCTVGGVVAAGSSAPFWTTTCRPPRPQAATHATAATRTANPARQRPLEPTVAPVIRPQVTRMAERCSRL